MNDEISGHPVLLAYDPLTGVPAGYRRTLGDRVLHFGVSGLIYNAQFLLYQSITRYYQSRYDYVLNAMRLRQAAGSLQVQDLEALDRFLVERKTPEELFADEAKAAASE